MDGCVDGCMVHGCIIMDGWIDRGMDAWLQHWIRDTMGV